MSNIIGTIYLVDPPHIDVLKNACLTNPPPKGRIATGTVLCMDMDETDNMLELWFPDHCQKATLLCPPPIAMYKEIDGDQEGFIEAYNEYLDTDESVQEFVASMLLFLHIGGNILLYTPSHFEDGAIWMNTLELWFLTRFGISIGDPTTKCSYDSHYDEIVAELMYMKGFMDVFDYILSSTAFVPQPNIQAKLYQDLMPFVDIMHGENPMELFSLIRMNCASGILAYKPALIFD